MLELLIVVSIMSILAALAMPSLSPGLPGQLQATARVIAGDLQYARSLAVANGSRYLITFDPTGNQYILRHSGNHAALNELPASPLRLASDSPDRLTVRVDALPHLGGNQLRLLAVTTGSGNLVLDGSIEFGPLGETTRAEETNIWITGGQADQRRYLCIRVDPVTGLATLGEPTSAGPSAAK